MVDIIYNWMNLSFWNAFLSLGGLFIIYVIACNLVWRESLLAFIPLAVVGCGGYIMGQGLRNFQGQTGDVLADGIASVFPILAVALLIMFPFALKGAFGKDIRGGNGILGGKG